MKEVRTPTMNMADQEVALIDHLIILLLGANDNDPIVGRIRFIKGYFIISEKHFRGTYAISEFYPNRFGPSSKRLGIRVNKLKDDGIILASSKGNEWYYYLSDIGRKDFEKLWKEVPEDKKKGIMCTKSRFAKATNKDVLKEVYEGYPQFAHNELLRDIVKCSVDLSKYEKIDDSGYIANSEELESRQEIEIKGDAAKKLLSGLMLD